MNLSEEDKKTIVDWLKEKCNNFRCVCCGLGHWDLAPDSVLLIGYDLRSTRFHYHAGIPLVGLTCKDCGHLLLFSPIVMGIKPDPPETHPSNSSPEEGSSGEE